MKNKLMTHVVAGYPTEQQCIELMLGMQNAGVFAIEVQIPFSDPSADGHVIMEANDVALHNGMTISRCFALIRKAHNQGLSVPIYVMSYVNKVHYYGFSQFCIEAANSHVSGLIIPDLPLDTPEYDELYKNCPNNGLLLVPVISPNITHTRLRSYLNKKIDVVYLTSTTGITGNKVAIHKQLHTLVKTIRLLSDCQIALGFGIQNLENIHQALEIADIAVIGSAIMKEVRNKNVAHALKFIKSLVGK